MFKTILSLSNLMPTKDKQKCHIQQRKICSVWNMFRVKSCFHQVISICIKMVLRNQHMIVTNHLINMLLTEFLSFKWNKEIHFFLRNNFCCFSSFFFSFHRSFFFNIFSNFFFLFLFEWFEKIFIKIEISSNMKILIIFEYFEYFYWNSILFFLNIWKLKLINK